MLDLGEEVLDQMARAIELSVVVSRRGPVGSRRDHRGLTSGSQRLDGASIGVEQLLSAISVSACIVGSRWSAPTRSVCPRHRSGRRSRSGCPARQPGRGSWCSGRRAACIGHTWSPPAFWAPALCWWARTAMVLSIIAYSLSASAARCWKHPLPDTAFGPAAEPPGGPLSRHRTAPADRAMASPSDNDTAPASTNSRLSAAVTPDRAFASRQQVA